MANIITKQKHECPWFSHYLESVVWKVDKRSALAARHVKLNKLKGGDSQYPKSSKASTRKRQRPLHRMPTPDSWIY